MKWKCAVCTLLLACLFLPVQLFAIDRGITMPDEDDGGKNITILTGRVMDAESKEEIPLATLSIANTTKGVACDANGRYHMELVSGKTYTLIVRSTGYTEQRVKIEANAAEKQMDIYLSGGMFDLNEVVVTGTRTEKTLMNTPVLTRVIPATQIQRNDFESIMDVLEYNIPGLQFNSDPRGDNIRIQGLENKYVLILVDGERLSTTPGGPIDFERLSTSNIKQIEVIKGAASALYGSSAMGMIVNIITKTPERKLEGWAKARYSRFDDLLLDAGVGFAHKSISSQTLFNRSSHDGYDLTPESPESFTRNPSTNMTVEERLTWTKNFTKIAVIGSYFENEVENPPLSSKNTHYKSNNKTIRAMLDQQLGEKNKLRFVYYGDFYTRKTIYEKLDSTSKNATSHVQTLRLTDIYSPVESLELIFGGEFNWNKDFNNMQYGTEIQTRKVNDINGFVQGDWQILPLLNLIGGLRYTHHSAFGNAYTPKVSLMFNPGQWKFRGGYSRGFKAPDATELYSDFQMGSVSHNIGNPNLKAENSNYFSLSAEYMFSKLNVSAELYRNKIENKIQSFYVTATDENGFTETQLRYDNIDDVRIQGAEINIDYYPVRNLNLRGSYAYTDAEDLNTGLQLRGNTKHAISCNAAYRFDLFKRETSVSLVGHWSSKKINDSEETIVNEETGKKETILTTNSQPAFSLWKLTVQYTPWKKGNMALLVTGGVQNLFDYKDSNRIQPTTFDPGRRFFGSLLFRF